jgi:hypothetical protein
MAADGPRASQRTLFVGLSTAEFNDKVREFSELYFNVVDMVPPTGTPGGPLLSGAGVIPYDAVVVSFSPAHGGQLPLAKTIVEVINAFPNSQYYFVFPDDQPEDPLEPFIDKVLDGRIRSRAVVSLRNFAAALEQNIVELSGSTHGSASVYASLSLGAGGADELFVTFDQSLSAAQIKDTLTALAAYYRACGGVGLPAEFESQEAEVLEDARV